jgi:hypothetical protein
MALAMAVAAASGPVRLDPVDDSLIYHLGCRICYHVVAALAVAAAAAAGIVRAAQSRRVDLRSAVVAPPNGRHRCSR